MTRPIQVAILPALAAALFFSLAALASQRGEMSELKRMSQSEYRAEVAQLVVSDPEYLRRLEEQSRPNALVTVTAYNADPAQTDSDPDIAASMRRVRPGTIAVSRDLFDRGWVFGRKVRLEGIGIYEINDLMASRHNHAIDIFIQNNSQALAFGKRRIKAALLNI
ncbi:MAG: 3D domain-containing protein [Proteobacteria bacterium]|nr:3D domain-containing protein [Pseudomonadota bacterium]